MAPQVFDMETIAFITVITILVIFLLLTVADANYYRGRAQVEGDRIKDLENFIRWFKNGYIVVKEEEDDIRR